MALLNKNNEYIKLEKDGSIVFYSSEDYRLKEKVISSEQVLNKYKELHNSLYQTMYDLAVLHGVTEQDYEDEEVYKQKQIDYPDFGKACDDYWSLYHEENNYSNDLYRENGPQQDYPIIEEYFPNVKDSIPVITFKGGITNLASDTVDESYEKAKENKYFGETRDC